MKPIYLSTPRSFAAAWLLAAISLLLPPAASAGSLHTLYSFCHSTGCPDGQTPFSGLAVDGNGNLFGTTLFGGNSSDHGTVYELAKEKMGWKFRSLYSFCTQTGCTDGFGPRGAVILDTSGNVYGTATGGGSIGVGVVFEISKTGKYQVLYNFCSVANCTDGLEPDTGLTYQGAQSGALYDGVSTLYGTTSGGGELNGGTVFTLTPEGAESVLYSFDPQSQDGHDPEAALVIDRKGNLFGTTARGGQFGSGTAFEIAGLNAETVLHSFCAKQNCRDGGAPASGALFDAGGNLLGSVPSGGTADGGILYQLTNTSYKVLVNFCTKSGCKKGEHPEGALTRDAAGNFFGVAPLGGTKVGNGGVVFEFNGALKTLYSFCNNTNCPDGGAPYSKVVLDASGDVFGTATQGGDFNGGTIFELKP